MRLHPARVASLTALAAIVAALLLPSSSPAQPRDARDASVRRVTIASAGDLLLHIKVNASAAQRGWAHVLGGLREVLRDDEIAFANLETPLVDDVRDPVTGSPPVLGAPSSAARGLAEAGLDVLGCANNHAHDQDASGMARTVDALRAANLVAVGADVDPERAFAAEIVEREGVRVAFLSYTERINRPAGRTTPRATIAWIKQRDPSEAIRAARARADVVVLAVHWSHDFIPHPHPRQRALARTWVEAGADLIVGTGPHVLQEVERVPSPRGEAVIAYSLGNLLSNQGQRWILGRRFPASVHPALKLAETRDGLLLRTRFSIEGDRVRLEALEGVALWTVNDFWERARRREREPTYDIRIQPLAQVDEPVRSDRLAAIRRAVGDAVTIP
ncbi:MAG: CapA family protein [Myxococcota bacterium]|jgi:poly-gamma-glutamate synthesis protein (capsule biosynthesis protein)|nr:CapA family protein [Myxococcota bacterium]